MEHAIEDYRYFLEEKQIRITIDLGNAQVLTDQRSLEFILAQLLANAITYLPAMQEEKEISFMAQHREKEVILLVKDNGIGVKPSDLPFVFERFYKTDKSRSANKDSTGLGLHIANAIISIHGGKITVKSEFNNFTEFSFVLPSINSNETLNNKSKNK